MVLLLAPPSLSIASSFSHCAQLRETGAPISVLEIRYKSMPSFTGSIKTVPSLPKIIPLILSLPTVTLTHSLGFSKPMPVYVLISGYFLINDGGITGE